MAVAKRKRREKPTENRTKEGPRTRMRTSGLKKKKKKQPF